MRNPKLVSDIKSDFDSKIYDVLPMSNWWAIQLYLTKIENVLFILLYIGIRIGKSKSSSLLPVNKFQHIFIELAGVLAVVPQVCLRHDQKGNYSLLLNNSICVKRVVSSELHIFLLNYLCLARPLVTRLRTLFINLVHLLSIHLSHHSKIVVFCYVSFL